VVDLQNSIKFLNSFVLEYAMKATATEGFDEKLSFFPRKIDETTSDATVFHNGDSKAQMVCIKDSHLHMASS
jgi:hypothetical protein